MNTDRPTHEFRSNFGSDVLLGLVAGVGFGSVYSTCRESKMRRHTILLAPLLALAALVVPGTGASAQAASVPGLSRDDSIAIYAQAADTAKALFAPLEWVLARAKQPGGRSVPGDSVAAALVRRGTFVGVCPVDRGYTNCRDRRAQLRFGRITATTPGVVRVRVMLMPGHVSTVGQEIDVVEVAVMRDATGGWRTSALLPISAS